MGMSQRSARFTQADIHRAIKAVEQAGADMAIEIMADGTIRISRNLPVSGVEIAGIENRPRRVP